MNIFAVDDSPIISAQSLHDQHVSKMILETAQMLSYVANRYGHKPIYKSTGPHKNHPATIWAGNRFANWLWLVEHGLALEQEKIFRTGVGHKSADVIRHYLNNNCHPLKDDKEKDPFALCMPQKYYNTNGVQAYRDFYVNEKQFFKNGKRPTWTKRSPPDWWKTI
jgi:hypothetical protein